jgi:lysozyme family protein
MANIPHLIAANERRWAAMHFNTSRIPAFASVSQRLVAPTHKIRYQAIAKTTGVPWFVIAVIHERESGQNFSTQLAQGDPLGSVSVHKPAGQGPYFNHPNDPPLQDAFYRAAIVALHDTGATKWADWSPGGSLTFLETYNGLGYANMGLASPYIWGGTSEQVAGKYISDGNFSASTWDTQLGCAGMLRYMQGLDPSIVFVNDTHAPEPTPIPTPVPVSVPVPTPTVPPVTTPVPVAPAVNWGSLFTTLVPSLLPLVPTVLSLFPLTAPFVPLVQAGLGSVNKAQPTGGVAATPPSTMHDLVLTGMYEVAITLKPTLPHGPNPA